MVIADDLTPLEILGIAIRSEIEAANLYQYMAGQVANRDLRQRLDREGRKIHEVIALPVKDPFHLPRALILAVESLERQL